MIILEKLKQIEKENDIEILYDAESGSRAWGHYNKDSDYDIRFIYKKNDFKEYLTLNNPCDVIDSDDGLYDIVGWDIKKALLLHYKSNPNLREWLISPVVYIPDINNIFRDLSDFNTNILKYHYRSLAGNAYTRYVKNQPMNNVNTIKRTLYVIRCILAWMVLDGGNSPSMTLPDLIIQSKINFELKKAILNIRDAYSDLTIDKLDSDVFNLVVNWIDRNLKVMNENNPEVVYKRDISQYNKRFQEIVMGN